ncbi:MAG: Coenzyme F420 hydrogenase/dehydrogenase, beta subunit C-terminal domain [Dehalococcoidales bacterium]|nr:Coenzyme F420 hydrogenase/dehydrogenase, beta subunit C-terminal domain [Dehalococcoidales bacterium]
MRNITLEITGGNLLDSIRGLFKQMLEKKLVDAILVPVELPSGNNVVQTLVSNPAKLDAANPIAPVLPVNSANILSAMTKTSSSRRKIAAVLRSCELRAVVELAKLNQVVLDNVILIGIDCFGTYSINDYSNMVGEGKSPTENLLSLVKSGDEDTLLRESCQVCEYPYPMNADIVIGLIGMDTEKEILVQGVTEQGEAILGDLELNNIDSNDQRQPAIEKLVEKRVKARDELFEKTGTDMYGPEKLLPVFERCVNCHNCRDACPICYCRECLFDSPTFDFGADKYLDWAEKREALRMPTDTLLFHLTRLNHMATSCVGCGLCQEACPNEVPVFSIFRMVGDQLQQVFEYVPGRSLDEEMPLTTFREDELQEVGYE